MNTDTIIVILAIPVAIIVNFFLLRLTTKMTYKKYGIKEVNPISVLSCFIGFIGTFILLVILLVDCGILDYKPKKK